MSIKCRSCGLNNWDTANICRRCNSPISAPVNVAPPLPPPPLGQPHVQPQLQRLGYQSQPGYQNPSPYQNPGNSAFQNQQPQPNNQQPAYPNIGQSYSNNPNQAQSTNPGQQVPLPINNPSQPNTSPYLPKPPQQFTLNRNGSSASNHQPYQNYPRPGNQPFAHTQPYPNYPNPNHPYTQPYQTGSPYVSNSTLQNTQPYQTVFPPPQAFHSPYAPRPFAPPPFSSSRSSVGPVIKIFLAILVVGAVVGFAVLRAFVSRERTESIGKEALTVKYLKLPNQDSESIEGIRENILVYIGKDRDSKFGYEEVRRQLFRGVDDIEYDQAKGEVYFYLSDCSAGQSSSMQSTIANFATDPSRAVYGEELKNSKRLSNGSANLGGANKCPLMIPINNVRLNPYANLELKFSTAVYTISVQELGDYLSDKSIYGGPMRIFSKDRVQRELNVFGNHGAFVAKPNEPSLMRLAGALISDTSTYSQNAREQRVQSLLDFVTSEIKYDQTEANFKGEILKRPEETLLARRGDCSSKTILLASLLEQIGEDYRLVYYLDHITVAVRKGNFANANGLSFSRESETWMIAESTVPGFVIGETKVENTSIFAGIQYVQKPSTSNEVSAFDDLKEIFFQ